LVSAICLLEHAVTLAFIYYHVMLIFVSFTCTKDYPDFRFIESTTNDEYTCMDGAYLEEQFGGLCKSYGQLIGSNGRTTQQSCCICGG